MGERGIKGGKTLNINVPILEKTQRNITEEIKVLSSTDVVNLEQVQAIRNAVKEHLLFIGVDRGNNIRNISILGIGSNCEVLIDSKDIIRTALLSCSEKVILVHNHPSNKLEPSSADIHITNVTNNLLKTFNIELLDHIIVTEKEYISMEKIKKFNNSLTDKYGLYRVNVLENDNLYFVGRIKSNTKSENNAKLKLLISELNEFYKKYGLKKVIKSVLAYGHTI